jgi:Protein of unknown function (DUF2589)
VSRFRYPPVSWPQIAECTIEFNAKINSITKSNLDFSLGLEASASGGGAIGPVEAKFSASFSTKITHSSSNTEEREYSMNIMVKASQSEMPSGMSRILSILEEAILIDVLRTTTADE